MDGQRAGLSADCSTVLLCPQRAQNNYARHFLRARHAFIRRTSCRHARNAQKRCHADRNSPDSREDDLPRLGWHHVFDETKLA